MDDYGYFGKGSTGYAHYTEAVKHSSEGKGGGGKRGGGNGCGTVFIIILVMLAILFGGGCTGV